jgi:iron complex outermembrane receptor protein
VSPALSWILVAATALGAPAFASAQTATPSLKRLSLDDLMQIEVTSVSKKEQKLSEAPSAIFVLTQDDLTRAGVTTIAEALRLVPGPEVARIDANKWAISARGFNGRFATKMLVLIDGRSVYTPLFSGV